jgi:hypothetical protein
MAKTISVSADDITYYVLPGSSGDFNVEAEGLEDTTFGQSFSSTETGLLSWTSSANAYWKGFAGYVTTIKKSGTTTAMTGDAMSLVSGKTYSIDAAAKEVWDHTATFVIYDGVTDVTAQVESINYLYGTVTFLSAYTVLGAVTVDGSYLPLAAYGKAQDFSLTQSAESVDTTDFDTAQGNGGYRTFVPGLRQVSLDLSGFYALSNGFKALLAAREECVIEISPDGAGASMCRGFFKPMTTGQSGDVGGNEQETVTFALSVPYVAGVAVTPFDWNHAVGSSIPLGVKTCLDAWEAETLIYVKYLSDGAAGDKGSVVTTDFSLSSGLSAMSEFSLSAQGSGAPTVI